MSHTRFSRILTTTSAKSSTAFANRSYANDRKVEGVVMGDKRQIDDVESEPAFVKKECNMVVDVAVACVVLCVLGVVAVCVITMRGGL